MSREYPIIAVTGSSGAGTTTVKRTFERMFARDVDTHRGIDDTGKRAVGSPAAKCEI